MIKGFANQPSKSNQRTVINSKGETVKNIAFKETKIKKNIKNALPELNIKKENLKKINDKEYSFNEKEYVNKSNDFLNTLNDFEKESINDYVISGYDEINRALYNNSDLNKEIEKGVTLQERIDGIDSAIAKYQDETPPALWRNLSGIDLPKSFLEKNYEIGEEINFDGFTSTSQTPGVMVSCLLSNHDYYMRTLPEEEAYNKKIEVPEDFKAPNVVFKIEGAHGAPVSMSRGRPNEREWLLPRNQRFIITHIEKDSELTDGYYTRNATVYSIRKLEN